MGLIETDETSTRSDVQAARRRTEAGGAIGGPSKRTNARDRAQGENPQAGRREEKKRKQKEKEQKNGQGKDAKAEEGEETQTNENPPTHLIPQIPPFSKRSDDPLDRFSRYPWWVVGGRRGRGRPL